MDKKISRREFVKLLGMGSLGLAINPQRFAQNFPITEFGRVTAESISVYEKPSDKSGIVSQRYRDSIINIYREVDSEFGPAYNPIWFRVWGGYIHSGYVQKVQYHLNPIIDSFPKQTQYAEVTVPFSQSYQLHARGDWEKLYMLYFSSVHPIFSVREGPDGQPWYEIRDSLVTLSYYIPAVHMHIIDPNELTPLSPNLAAELKRIEISIDMQQLTAFEDSKIVKQVKVSTGRPYLNPDPNLIPTDTPKGEFHIQAKRPSVHMGDGTIRSDVEAYELPGVPWVSYFESSTGVAIHGTYWHNNYGVTMSHGCVNMRSEDAKWVYRWTLPQPNTPVTYRTPVLVY
jgi:lipoprotein-anchoring transpeptidase ErfK/SrfK